MTALHRVAVLALACLALAALPAAAGASIKVSNPVDVTADQTSQNETPIAVNPANSANMFTGSNDWNYNDGCGLNVTFDGGKSWTPSLPNGFLPAITRYTNDPAVPGTGNYDAGGDPAIAFSPDGRTAYYVCQAFDFTSPFQIALLLNRSSDGGRTWQTNPVKLTQISTWNGNGTSKGSNGQFPDHESIHVDQATGAVYVTWAQFNGQGTHSPVYVAVSHDGGKTFSAPAQVTAGTVRNNQDQRITTDPAGHAFLTFDNGVQGGKGTVLYVSESVDGGATWSTPVQFAALTNPVCTFPPGCFNISGGAFRSGGTYPAPAFDAARDRLYVIAPDIRGTYAQVYLWTLNPHTLQLIRGPVAVAPGAGDQFQSEISTSPGGRIDISFYDRRYSANQLVDLTYATSADGGATWQRARVTPAGFDPSQWGVPSGTGFRPFIGDYNGIASTATGASMTWTGFAPPQPFNLETDYASATP
jgi:hypothetical protein